MVLGSVTLVIVICYGTARFKKTREERNWFELDSSYHTQDITDVGAYHHGVPPLYRHGDYQSISSNASFKTSQRLRLERAHLVTNKLQHKVRHLIPPWIIAPLPKPRSKEPGIEMDAIHKPSHVRPSTIQNSNKQHDRYSPYSLRLDGSTNQYEARRHYRHASGSEYSSSSKPALPRRMHHSFLPPLIIPSLIGSSVQQVSRPQPIAAKDLAYGSRRTWDEISISRSARRREHDDVWPSPDSRWRLTPDLRDLLLHLILEEHWMNPCEVAYDFMATWRRATIFGLSAITTTTSNTSPMGPNMETWRSSRRGTQESLWSLWPGVSVVSVSSIPKRRRKAFWSRR